MRNILPIIVLVTAMFTWLLGVFLGFQEPAWGIAGTPCTLALLALALKIIDGGALANRLNPIK